jgi:lipopolysaccharide export LptBFGC system permease protein LptF
MVQVLIKDESPTGTILNEIEIAIQEEGCTLRDLIAARVEKEVDLYNQKIPDYFNGLVQPTDSEQTLNGFKLKKRNKIDAEQQVYTALEAFLKNGFFVLVDDQQVTELDQPILINKESNISFMKLTQLVGG